MRGVLYKKNIPYEIYTELFLNIPDIECVHVCRGCPALSKKALHRTPVESLSVAGKKGLFIVRQSRGHESGVQASGEKMSPG